MALTQATYVENGKVVGGVVPDASSAIGYKEKQHRFNNVLHACFLDARREINK